MVSAPSSDECGQRVLTPREHSSDTSRASRSPGPLSPDTAAWGQIGSPRSGAQSQDTALRLGCQSQAWFVTSAPDQLNCLWPRGLQKPPSHAVTSSEQLTGCGNRLGHWVTGSLGHCGGQQRQRHGQGGVSNTCTLSCSSLGTAWWHVAVF